MKEDSDLLKLVLNNDNMFQLLEYLYISGKVSGNIARSECDTHTLNVMKNNKLVDRRFLKRGTYVSSTYWISKTGKYIYELAVVLRRDI
jgi:hypothetical protein